MEEQKQVKDMNKHKHEWAKLFIPPDSDDERVEYMLLVTLNGFNNFYYCTGCHCTGYSVYGKRIKKHSDFYTNELVAKHHRFMDKHVSTLTVK